MGGCVFLSSGLNKQYGKINKKILCVAYLAGDRLP
jgi:hypothetical protein